jgi:tetratricopeptide (TPR) repeat protein
MASETKILLLTMVKNESRIIERLMGSVKGRVDGIIICDTGSTDSTVSLANEYLATHAIPGTVYSFPFKNFGASRTKSFECCQDWVKKNGWNADTTWALLLDGDMMMDQPIQKEALAAQSPNVAGLSLKQANGSLVYSNVRLIRCSEPWICKGATHEAWTCPPTKQTNLLESPVLRDHGDGGCKSDKYERDVRLLKEDLEEMPNDARTHFYLGQTYLCMRDWKSAIPILKRRVELGGWDEETYMAEIYIGECYENLGEHDKALYAWLQAWQRRQHRTEGAVRAITMLRRQPKSQFMAKILLDKLFQQQFGENLDTGEPCQKVHNGDLLFVNKRDVEYHIWEELSILAYYTGIQRQTWLQIDNLDLKNGLGWHDMNTILSQMHWYDWCLKPRRKTRFQIPLEMLPWAKEEEAAAWQPFNPSIRPKADGSGYQVNLRYANYYTAEAKHYHYRAFHGKVLTRNCLMDVPRDATWNAPASLEEILIDPAIPQRDHYIRGVEDCRLIQNADSMEFLGTSQSYSSNGTNKIMKVWRTAEAKEADAGPWTLRQLPLPAGVSQQDTQKNWLGFRHGPSNELLYIYNFSPFQICRENGETVIKEDGGPAGLDLKEYRGSAGPVPWSSSAYPNEAWLCVMHKVYIGGEGRRYYHRFMTLGADLKPSRVSCFVRMTKERVEYWSGMTRSLEGDSYWITYGLKDSEAYAAEMKTEDIENVMFYDFMRKDRSVPTKERIARLKGF